MKETKEIFGLLYLEETEMTEEDVQIGRASCRERV